MTLQSNRSARTFFEFLNVPLSNKVRLLLVLLVVPVALSYLFPLWRISMVAPQYPNGLWVDIFSWTITGGHEGKDLDEINVLNHYIGMHKIERYELTRTIDPGHFFHTLEGAVRAYTVQHGTGASTPPDGAP